MENLIYWCGGFFVAYLVVRGIRSLWAGGFCFFLASGLTVSAFDQVYVLVVNDTGANVNVSSITAKIGGVSQGSGQDTRTHAGGCPPGSASTGTINNGETKYVRWQVTDGDNESFTFHYPFASSGSIGSAFTTTPCSGSTPNGLFVAVGTVYLSGYSGITYYTNYVSVDCVTNTLGVPADFRFGAYVHFSPQYPSLDGVTDTVLVSDMEQVRRLQPGQVWCITNEFLVPVDGFFVGPGNPESEWQPHTNNPAGPPGETVSTNTLNTNILGSGTPMEAPDPFANIPLRDVSSSNANQIVQRGAEGIVQAIGDSDSLIGGKLDRIYGALTNGTGGDGSGTNDASEDLLLMIATNTFAMSNMVVNVTNLSGFQGMASSASNTAIALYGGGTNTMGEAFASGGGGFATNAATTLFSPGARAPTALLTIPLGSLAGNDYEINLDPNQTGSIGAKIQSLLDLLTFSKKYAAMIIFIGLFWAMYSYVEDYTVRVIQNAGRIAKLPSVGVTDMVGRAALGVWLAQIVTVVIGILPWAAFAVMSLYFNSAAASSVPNLDVEADAAANLTGVMKEVFLRYFWAIGHGIPFAEMLSAFIQWVAFRFYMPWLFGFVITIIDTYAIMVIGRCILPFLFVVGASGAQIELHNMTGTNLLWTNSTRLIQFPPGESRIDIESGWYLTNGSEVPLPETENVQVLRFSLDPDGALTLDYSFATSPADYFWYGFAAGLSIFGVLAWVSVIKAGIGVGLKNNVYVRD